MSRRATPAIDNRFRFRDSEQKRWGRAETHSGKRGSERERRVLRHRFRFFEGYFIIMVKSRNKSSRGAGCSAKPKTGRDKGNYGKVTKERKGKEKKAAAAGKTKLMGSRRKAKHSSIKDRVAAAKTRGKPGDKKTSKGGKGKPKPRKSAKQQRSRTYSMTMTPSPCGDTYAFLTSVPWFDGKSQGETHGDFPRTQAASGKSGSDCSGFELPGEDILGFLDQEIAMFSNYVRLSQSELHARQSFLEHVTELARTKFERTRGKYCKGVTDEYELGDVHCHPFGSFATQSVCTFASDVDMCLWGVVPGKKTPGLHAKANVADFFEDQSPVHDGVPILTESSLLRTMNAIESSSGVAQVDMEPGNEKARGQSDDISTESKKEKEADGQDGCFFFIDREGTYAETCRIETRDEVGPLISESRKPCGTQSITSSKLPAANGESFQVDINTNGLGYGGDETTESSDLPESVKIENKAGSSKETAIEIGDSSDDDSEIELDSIDSDGDSADKLSAFFSRHDPTAVRTGHDEGPGTGKNNWSEREDANGKTALSMKRPLETLELSLTSTRAGTSEIALTKPSFGPTGKDRCV